MEETGGQMNDKQAAKAKYISELLSNLPSPRNQIASISGLTNTYIRDLEQGNIVNVPREKLIALAMAINLELNETNQLLHVFDRARLSTDDVEFFANAFDKMKLTSAVYPICDYFAYELACGSIEQHPGKQIIVNDKPTNSLKEPGHRSYSQSFIKGQHPIIMKLIEAIGKKRRQILENVASRHIVEHIIFREHLEEYLLNCEDKEERYWRGLHVANLIHMINTYPNFRVYLVETASSLLFTIKYTSKNKAMTPMLTYCAIGSDRHAIWQSRRLTGFATSSDVLVKNFEREAEDIKRYLNHSYLGPPESIKYFEHLILKSK